MGSVDVVVICPTYNAGKSWAKWIEALKAQSFKPLDILIIDSGSSDQTMDLSLAAGFEVWQISNSDFNHGGTRNFGAGYLGDNKKFLVYLTQDAILADADSIKNLIKPFEDKNVGAVCGRQIPHLDANTIESHARLFNYSSISFIKDRSDIHKYGIKTAFMSNSFAAYRYDAFKKCGGFPSDTIFAEDMSLAAKMILKNYKVAYSAEAKVFHSHDYSIVEEFKRYFDVGVFYSRENWIKQEFGKAGGEGLRFVMSEIKYLMDRKGFLLIPNSLLRNFLKLVAFKLGAIEEYLPLFLKRKLSMNKRYWK